MPGFRRKAVQRSPVHRPAAATGECGKVAYLGRKHARRTARLQPDQHLRPYRCPTCQLWHLGHLPPAVAEGRKTAREVYGSPTTEEEVTNR